MKSKEEVMAKIAELEGIIANNERIDREIVKYCENEIAQLRKSSSVEELVRLALGAEIQLTKETVESLKKSGAGKETIAKTISTRIRQKTAELRAQQVEEDFEYFLIGLRECLELFESREPLNQEIEEQIKHSRRFVDLFTSEAKGRIDAASWILGIEPDHALLADGVPCPEWEQRCRNLAQEIEVANDPLFRMQAEMKDEKG